MLLSKPELLEQRSNIRFCVLLGKTAADTYKTMLNAHGNDCMSRSRVHFWYAEFKNGQRKEIQASPRSGRPVTVTTSDVIGRVRALILEDRRVSLYEICEQLDMSYGTVQRIVTEKLEMSRVCARWVPHILTEEQMNSRVQTSSYFLSRYQREGLAFLQRLITTDEVWVNFFTPETKQSSMVWKFKDEGPPTKAKACKSKDKVMYILFIYWGGILLNHQVPQGVTVNSDYYTKVC